jgi:hypothetical protein
MMPRRTSLPFLVWLIVLPVHAAELSADAINDAQWRGSAHDEALLVKSQVLLDRAHFSPGEIDGRNGENDRKALTAFAQEHGIDSTGEVTEALLKELSASSQEPLISKHTLSDKDAEGPFLDKVPTKLDDMKGLKALSYGSAREGIAERFHRARRFFQD